MSKDYKNLYLKYKGKYISEKKKVKGGSPPDSLYVSDLTQSTIFQGLTSDNESGITVESLEEIKEFPIIEYNTENRKGKLEFELNEQKKFIDFIERDQIFNKEDIIFLFFTKNENNNTIKMYYFTNKDPSFINKEIILN
tara:strand:+ start:1712 stop:2128 length:417 start_codon:yes stop_codon:yes gene_type:complete